MMKTFNINYSQYSPVWWLETWGEKLIVINISVTDLQMGEVSLRAVHLDKVALGSGHYLPPMKTVMNKKHHRELVNSRQLVV